MLQEDFSQDWCERSYSSMKGEKFSTCKAAIRHVVASMRTRDTLSLVAFSEDAEVVFTRLGRKDEAIIFAMLSDLTTQRYTNISAAVKAAVRILKKVRDTRRYDRG